MRLFARAAPGLLSSLLALPIGTRAAAQGLSHGPCLVEASSVSARACWRRNGEESCQGFSGLAPGSPFAYAVPGSTRSYAGRALPGPSQPLRFAVFGDTGQGREVQWRVAEVLERLDPQMVLHLGDIVYPRGEEKDYEEKYFKPYARLLPRIPFYTTLGNHDYGNSWSAETGQKRFEEVYARIHHKPKYYSFDSGPAHFTAIDDNEAYPISAAAPIGPGSEQWRWLKEDLERSRAKWKFVFMHIPLYSSRFHHGDNAYLRRSLEPLFQKYGVDVVFAGHDHIYERSRMIGGVLHMTVGTGGGKLHSIKSTPDWLEKQLLGYGLVSARLEPQGLLLEFLDERGSVQDRFRIDKTDPKVPRPESVRFETEDGWTITGIYRPPLPGKDAAVLIHGVASSKSEWERFSKELWKLGLGTLAIDLRGHGESTHGPRGTQDFQGFGPSGEWPRAEKDISAALKFLDGRKIPPSHVGLVGASIGANLASSAAAAAKSPWLVLLSPGRSYRGVPLAELAGRKVLVGASPSDPYAYETAASLGAGSGDPAPHPGAPLIIEARAGHGVGMFDDPNFLRETLSWIKEAAGN